MRRVHLTAGDDSGWAIDEDLRLLRLSLAEECRFTSLARAEIVHSVWWQRLLGFSRPDFRGKHVLCYADNAPFHYAGEPRFLQARELVTLWIARSREAVAQFEAMGIESRFAPYTFDPALFHPLAPDDADVRALVEKWRIPTDRYLIANFHRDTEGGDLQKPKLQKGPDAFLEIVAQLHAEGAPVHVLLAGPRRFYLRTQLARRGVPFTFIGEETGERDDYAVNILPRATLNLLYRISDVYLIASRWEGGPHSVLEAAASRCQVVSTPVGIAPDVLAAECLFESVDEACAILRRAMREKHLDAFTEQHFQRVHAQHTQPALHEHLVEIYRTLTPRSDAPRGAFAGFGASVRRLYQRVRSHFPAPSAAPLTIAHFHQTGGENAADFDDLMTGIASALERCGCTVSRNVLTPATNAVLMSDFPSDAVAATLRQRPDLAVIYWISEGAWRDGKQPLETGKSCVILPSIDALRALRQRGCLPPRVMVLSAAAPKEPSTEPEPLVVTRNDAWAAERVMQALAQGRPILYPADSHYRWLVWFAGLAYRTDAELPQKLDTLRAHFALFARMIPPADPQAAAERLGRLFRVCRDSFCE